MISDTKVAIGIDPGQAGAIALIYQMSGQEILDMPLLPNREIDTLRIFEFLSGVNPELTMTCMIEKSQPMPKQGVVGVFTYGQGYGKLKAILEILQIPYQEIEPTKWKKEFTLIKKDKKESVTVAMKLFPKIKLISPRGRMIDGRAEALLIAEYCARKTWS